MIKVFKYAKNFILDLLFPPFCIGCGREETYLCQDCASRIEILEYQYCPFCNTPKITPDGKTCPSCRKSKNLSGLYSATSYQDPLVKKMISLFKYKPFIKELSKPLTSLIIAHFQILGKMPEDFNQFTLIPVPLHKKQLKKRGYNQSAELAKEISLRFKIPILNNALVKIKQTISQTKLNRTERLKNVRGVFEINPSFSASIKNKKILLVDDVFTTGSTMEECAKTLKKAGAKEVWGVTIARE